jgi:hypothetical protein
VNLNVWIVVLEQFHDRGGVNEPFVYRVDVSIKELYSDPRGPHLPISPKPQHLARIGCCNIRKP